MQAPLALLCFALAGAYTPASWQGLALGGGGRALPEETASVTGNPAAVSAEAAPSGELGVHGLTQMRNPWVSGSFPVGRESRMGLAVLGSASDSSAWHLRPMVSSRLFAQSWVGLQAEVQQQIGAATTVDFALGSYHQVTRHWRWGAHASSLTESDSSSPRQLGLGTAWVFDRDEHFALTADLMISRFRVNQSSSYSPSAGFLLAFGSMRNLQLAASLHWQSEEGGRRLSYAGGAAFQQYFFQSLVSLRYALQGGSSLAHHVSVGFSWRALQDRRPPKPLVRATYARIAPLGSDSLPQRLDFLLRIQEETGKLAEWNLVLFRADSQLQPAAFLRRFRGNGVPPQSIAWAGDDASGSPAPPGIYTYRLIAQDAAGNQAWTEWQLVEIE